MSLWQELGDKEGMALLLGNFSEVARCEGNYTEARALYEEALTLANDVGTMGITNTLLRNKAKLAHREGEHGAALSLFRQSLDTSQRLGAKEDTIECLVGLAEWASAHGLWERAAILSAAAEMTSESIDYRLHPIDREEFRRCIILVSSRIDKPTWEAAWAEGRAMTLEAAIALALQDAPQQHAQVKTTRGASPYPYTLTKREVDVLRLVAEGLTDSQIAQRLFLSPNTIHSHLYSIYSKLGITTRAAAGRFAVDHDLT